MVNFEEAKLKKIVANVIGKLGFRVDSQITISKGSGKGDGYLGEIVRILVEDGLDTLNLIAKISLKDDKLRATYPYSEAFENEIIAYEKILPALLNLQIEANISPLFNPTARFYSASSVLNQEYLILEDLKVFKFEMLGLKELYDHDHAKAICETYGKFHGLSFAMKILKGENFKELVSHLNEVPKLIFDVYNIGKELPKFWSYIQNVMREKGAESERINKYAHNAFIIIKDMYNIRENDFSCFLHGDCWSNNLMFKHKNKNGCKKVQDVKLIDWQECCFGPPVYDLSYNLYSGASKKIMDNLEMYLKIYHERLSKILFQFALDANSVYPFEEFKRQWKKYYHYGTIQAAPVWKVRSFGENQGVDPLDHESDDDSSFLHAICDAECDRDYLYERMRELMFHLDEIDGQSIIENLLTNVGQFNTQYIYKVNMKNLEKNKLIEILRTIIGKHGFGDNSQITISKGSDKGDGYLGEIVRILVEDGMNTLNLIGKISLKDEKLRASFPYSEAFRNEIIAYKKILPALLNLQMHANISPLFNPTARFYYASSVLNQEYLILEDLKVSKFEMLGMKELYDHDHAKAICETYGKFHGLSFAMKILKEENFNELVSHLNEVIEKMFDVYNIGREIPKIWAYIQKVMREKGVKSERINKYAGNSYNIMKDMCGLKESEFCCLLHGDCWSNNLMFKHKTDDGYKKVEELKLIDFQVCRLGLPVYDLSYNLYSGASKEIMDNLEMYLKIYHESLSKILFQFALEANSVYPFEELKRQWKKYYHYGTILAAPIWKFRSFGENQGVDPLNHESDDDSSFLHAICDADCDKDYLFDKMKELMYHLDEIDDGRIFK